MKKKRNRKCKEKILNRLQNIPKLPHLKEITTLYLDLEGIFLLLHVELVTELSTSK
jgi:hypothetical protein